ncbi:MAG: CvpA family protein [Rhodobacteraceae bacterium]|jgi:membrane protein required for colicin V production|nr:CvpA family protein [Paracoccaceae bacterium]
MEGFNIVDGIVLATVVISSLLAYARGLVREVMAIVGWIVAAIAAFVFAPQVMPLVKEIPVVGSILADSCELSIIASFAAVFAIALLIMSFFTPLLSSLINKSMLGKLDQSLGFIFGVIRGIALIAIGFFAYNTVLSAESFPMIDKSRSAQVFGDMATSIEERNPERALGWVTLQYEQLVSVCEPQ